MEINEGFCTIENVIDEYCKRRKNIEKKDVQDLLKITVKYINKKLTSNDFYAVDFSIGTFFKKFNMSSFLECRVPKTKKEKLEEKLLFNKLFKNEPEVEYNYNEIETLKQNTNNSPIKN